MSPNNTIDENMSTVNESIVGIGKNTQPNEFALETATTSAEYYNALVTMAKSRNFKGNFPIPKHVESIFKDIDAQKNIGVQHITGFYVLIHSIERYSNRKKMNTNQMQNA